MMNIHNFMIFATNEISGSNLLMQIRPSTRASVEPSVAGAKRLSRLCVCGRGTLQLLDYVPALLQQGDNAARSGDRKRARDHRGGVAGFPFRCASSEPLPVALSCEPRRTAWPQCPQQ